MTALWVESAKLLFKVKFRLNSALFSSNTKLQLFFQNCSDSVDDTEWLLESENPFESVAFDRILPHLHVLLNRLLQIFTRTGTIGLSAHVLKLLVSLVDLCIENGHKQELREFVRFHCFAGGEFDPNARLLFEGILESIGLLLTDKKLDQSILIKTLKHLWFILDICVKSMAQTIILNGSNKTTRRKRFSPFTADAMQTTFSEVTQKIVQHHRKFVAETRSANVALAYFAKYCLNLTDRGIVFGIIYDLVKVYDVFESGLPKLYKLEFLQLLASHEHFIPLNLPVLFDFNGKPIFNNLSDQIVTEATVNVENFQLSKTYCQMHFLLGLLIQEFSMGLHEPRVYRRLVVTLIRNLLVKHSGDVRYDNAIAQSRISVLYAPFISVILENIGEFELVRRFEPKEIQQVIDDQRKFDYPQASARSIISKDQSFPTARQNDLSGTQKIAQFAEKLDVEEAKDLVLCCLYLLNHLPRPAIVALSLDLPNGFALNEQTENFPIIQLIKLAIRLFRCKDKTTTKPIQTQSKKTSLTVRDVKAGNVNDRSLKGTRKTIVQEAHLAQEVALICLDVTNALAEHVSRWNTNDVNSNMKQMFNDLVRLQLELAGEEWPENCRLHALNSLAMLIELFSTQLASNYGSDALSRMAQRFLFFLNSQLEKVQASSAALLHLLIRQGFDNTVELYKSQTHHTGPVQDLDALNQAIKAEWLGNPGVQIISSVANLLGQNELSTDCSNFERGLRLFESLTAKPVDKKAELFRQAAQDLTDQIRDIFKATTSIQTARNDPIRLADLHLQLANNYRGSPALRIAWFETLSQLHLNDRWYGEAAVCQSHITAIMAKQLSLRDNLEIDFSLFDTINTQISIDEHLNGPEIPATQSSKFTQEALTQKVEETMKNLMQAERYESCGPLARIAIPIYEKQLNHKALISIYADLNQASSRAFEVQISGKRHLATYYRIILHSPIHFGDENNVEYVYRMEGLISLAEASERMVQLFKRALGTDNVRFLTELDIDPKTLDPKVANIQLTFVEPLCCPVNADLTNNFNEHLQRTQTAEMNFAAHTNIQQFFYEKPMVLPAKQNEKISEQARLALKRVFLRTDEGFPNTRRRLKVIKRVETTLNPLELACENLHKKSAQIQRLLDAAGISSTGPLDRCKINGVDIKGLQCLLQGSVSPTVNAGVLSYAEAFCSDSQRLKYGENGIGKLKAAFRVFIAQLARALTVNSLLIGQDQTDYQIMLTNSFDGMIERLSTFFDGENFLPEQITPTTNVKMSNDQPDNVGNSRNSTYILDSISGLGNRS